MTEPLFTIPLWADLLGVGLGGVQGAMFASGFQGQRRLDLLGVAIIGILIGMGGGLIRDLMLGLPPATLQSNWYLLTATGAAIIGMLLAGLLNRANGVIVGLDAIVIGMFGAFGTSKAIGLGVPPVPAVFIGVCAAVGGSILRDVIMGLPVAIMHVGSLYAVAAAAGSIVIVSAYALGLDLVIAGIVGIVVTAVIRVLAVIFDLSLPEQRRLYRRKVAAETGMIPIIKP
ncbi:putative membrane protein YeiH [Microbacterium keratanolyticum]|uniref:Membrane protein n=2 Tax=Microbacterium keratanolyticum TaxID=67574 RepID=A0A9W6HSX5_9MICO|nr:TRIC cation channel family protein [Microbacterium keratanolyticum]MBM7470212.1 putative membrane protein YeiH [Microbacterium keratanolyticum]GLK02291.1 membrane protein [Microbacterium keratanolyticum]